MSEKGPTGQPWFPPPYSKYDVAAIQALMTGTASDHQQQRALKWIIETACATYDLSFRPDNARATDFAEGKRHVGLQLVKLTKLNLAKLKD